MDNLTDTNNLRVSRPISFFRMQQAFLRVILDALMRQLYWTEWAQESARISTARTQCATIAYLQRWQRQSRQRCVNAVPVWNGEQHAVGDPLTALAAA